VTPYNSLRLIYFLWQIGIVDSLTLIQFTINDFVQYGVFVVGHTVGQNLEPSALIAPITQLGTAYQYVRGAQGAMEAHKRAATLAALLGTSTAVLETDIATNGAMAGLHVAFNAYMQSVIEMSNNGSTPFVLITYKVGQEKIIFLVVAAGVVFLLIYYYIKLVIKVCRKGYEIGKSENFRNKVAKFVTNIPTIKNQYQLK